MNYLRSGVVPRSLTVHCECHRPNPVEIEEDADILVCTRCGLMLTEPYEVCGIRPRY